MKDPASTRALLRSLTADFAAFRAWSLPQARIPSALRQAVLKALDAGIERTAVTKVLGISSSQIKVWGQDKRPSDVEQNAYGQVRVLSDSGGTEYGIAAKFAGVI